MKAKRLSFVTAACVAALCSTSFAYTISGKVSDDQGKALKDVDVSLLKEGKTAKTDDEGKFTIHEDENVGIHPAYKNSVGYISINNGILSYSQSSTSPVQVKIYNSLGNQVFKKTLHGSGTYDLSKGLEARGTYFAQVSVGNAKQNIKFTTDGSYSQTLGAQASNSALMKDAAEGEAIRFVLDGYDTLSIALNTLDTILNVKLTKTVPPEPTFKFGYALGNKPTPSKGCGTTSKLQKTKSVENGDRFEMRVGSDNREYFITLPKNYDNKKPYKLLFAMHCMGSNAEDFVHHYADQDHPSPYYGQQKLDTEGNYIFVSPRGDTDGMPWSVSSDKDHKFINQLLTTLEENYCIDTSRVFMTGFSFGAMVTNSMAQDRRLQHLLAAEQGLAHRLDGSARQERRHLPVQPRT
ncbi:T9SS type A sorting domain-containing protein [Fibrobacter succinogenes]|uniref:T9SS type A sorting domain-containing protein n=1 Tax=Fibrobacter succinogenes TaxID=833 RepID=UPI0026F029D3|nr:T9SS type A sorting domain-containing protein [Fibrobacter succinogenes]